MPGPFSRRDFTRAALAGAAVAAAPAPGHSGRVLGANDRVHIGWIGVGYRAERFTNHDDPNELLDSCCREPWSHA
ncbi:MAG: hypothetical protein ACLQGP_31145 [Isosphaeraceae bacterium]